MQILGLGVYCLVMPTPEAFKNNTTTLVEVATTQKQGMVVPKHLNSITAGGTSNVEYNAGPKLQERNPQSSQHVAAIYTEGGACATQAAANYEDGMPVRRTQKPTAAMKATKKGSGITRVTQQSSGSNSSARNRGISAVRAHAAGDGAVVRPRDNDGKPLQEVIKDRGCAGTLGDGDSLRDAMEDRGALCSNSALCGQDERLEANTRGPCKS